MYQKLRDHQRSKVYKWERTHIAPYDHTPVPYENIKAIVDYVWANEGLLYPPCVEPMPKQKHALGDATRTTVRFVPTTYSWVILHELSHALSSNIQETEILAEGLSNQHGAIFMGIYVNLLSKYLHLDVQELIQSAEAIGLRVNPFAKPVFL